MADMIQFTAAETAFLLRQPLRTVTKELDRWLARPAVQRGQGSNVRVIDRTDLFYLFAVKALRDDLTPGARLKIHAALRLAHGELGDEVRFGRFRVAVADIVDEMAQRIAELAALQKGITFASGGKPVLNSRGIAVHRIAALLNGGLSVDAILEEYPSLERSAVETAYYYAQARPKAGRPYPRTTANRAIRDNEVATPDDPQPENDDC